MVWQRMPYGMTFVSFKLTQCNRLLQALRIHWQGQIKVCDSLSTLTNTMVMVDSKGFALNKARMVIFPHEHLALDPSTFLLAP